MRTFTLALALAGVAYSAPTPQDIDFSLAYALPNPSYSTAEGTATAQSVTYNSATVYDAALAQITATTTDTAVATSTDANQKRAASSSTCSPQPTGYGPVPSPDSASAFLAYSSFASMASAAPVPSGYSLEFTNLQGSSSAYGYLGYTNLKTYDVAGCAASCNAINGCISINIYFERDPTVNPDDPSCANPASTTTIKCVFWGGPVNSANALNTGQYRDQFQVVIAGSNGYTNNSVAAVPGYSTAVPLGNAAINAPYDSLGFNTYMGSTIFVGAFNAELCAAACTEKSNYALAHPPSNGGPVQTCQFFNTYILYINSTKNIQGQYCAMYSESWSSSYATNVGQYATDASGWQDHFLIEYSFAYSNSTNPGSPSALAAEYQAETDILWSGNSALPYCSSLLGYTTPVTTSTSTVTVTPTVTASFTTTDITTTTDEVFVKRQDTATASSTVTIATSGSLVYKTVVPVSTATIAARSAGISEPAVLTKYPASIVKAGCSLAVSPVSSTSTVTAYTTVTTSAVSVSTTTTTTQTTTVTQTSTTSVSSSTSIPCGQTVSLDFFAFVIDCNVELADTTDSVVRTLEDSTYSACSSDCGSNEYCFAFQFDETALTCVEYAYYSQYTLTSTSSDVVFGYFYEFSRAVIEE